VLVSGVPPVFRTFLNVGSRGLVWFGHSVGCLWRPAFPGITPREFDGNETLSKAFSGIFCHWQATCSPAAFHKFCIFFSCEWWEFLLFVRSRWYFWGLVSACIFFPGRHGDEPAIGASVSLVPPLLCIFTQERAGLTAPGPPAGCYHRSLANQNGVGTLWPPRLCPCWAFPLGICWPFFLGVVFPTVGDAIVLPCFFWQFRFSLFVDLCFPLAFYQKVTKLLRPGPPGWVRFSWWGFPFLWFFHAPPSWLRILVRLVPWCRRPPARVFAAVIWFSATVVFFDPTCAWANFPCTFHLASVDGWLGADAPFLLGSIRCSSLLPFWPQRCQNHTVLGTLRHGLRARTTPPGGFLASCAPYVPWMGFWRRRGASFE